MTGRWGGKGQCRQPLATNRLTDSRGNKTSTSKRLTRSQSKRTTSRASSSPNCQVYNTIYPMVDHGSLRNRGESFGTSPLKNALTFVCRCTHMMHTLYAISGGSLIPEAHSRTPVGYPSLPSSNAVLSLPWLENSQQPREVGVASSSFMKPRARGSTKLAQGRAASECPSWDQDLVLPQSRNGTFLESAGAAALVNPCLGLPITLSLELIYRHICKWTN